MTGCPNSALLTVQVFAPLKSAFRNFSTIVAANVTFESIVPCRRTPHCVASESQESDR
jgi:hypothetical protein